LWRALKWIALEEDIGDVGDEEESRVGRVELEEILCRE
jgi:hypothetical protein